MSPRSALVLRLVVLAIVIALLAVFVRSIDWSKLGDALAQAKLWPLLVSSAIYFVCLYLKALSWRILLAPTHVVRTGRLFRYTIAAFAASALAPARTGELLGVWALKRRDGVPAADGSAVAIAEKLLDVVSLLVFVAPLPWLLPQLPTWVTNTMLLGAGIAVGVLAVLYFAIGRVEARHPRSWFARFIAGMHALRHPRRVVLALAALLVMWAADLTAVMLVLYAVGLDVSIPGGMFILFTFNLAVALPSTPAQLGALQLGALVATRLLGIPDEPALAFALLYQIMQIVPLLVIGLALELRLVTGKLPAEHAATHP